MKNSIVPKLPVLQIIPAILESQAAPAVEKIKRLLTLFPLLQLDVMDGVFVPNLTPQDPTDFDLPPGTGFLEVHLMVQAGAAKAKLWATHPAVRRVIPHIEAIDAAHFADLRAAISAAGKELGLAINPQTPLERLLPLVPQLDSVLVMGVQPGFSGQKFLPQALTNIAQLRATFSSLPIGVDGGINRETGEAAAKAGANLLCAASFLFKENKPEAAARQLLEIAANVYNCHDIVKT